MVPEQGYIDRLWCRSYSADIIKPALLLCVPQSGCKAGQEVALMRVGFVKAVTVS